MKVNIIYPKNDQIAITDANILNFLFRKIKHNITPKFVDLNSSTCENASMNIFIEIVNPLLIPYAKTNILLVDGSSFQKSYVSTLRNIDHVFTKTSDIIANMIDNISKENVHNIGWRSTDLSSASCQPNYSHFLLFCFNPINYRLYQQIIKTWNTQIETSNSRLSIVNFNLCKMDESEITNPSITVESGIDQRQFETLFNNAGVHICLEDHYEFSHYLNQSMLCKSIVLVSNNEVKEFASGDYAFYVDGKKTKHKSLFGSKFSFSDSSFVSKVMEIDRLNQDTLENLGVQARSDALKYQSKNDHTFKEIFTRILKETLSKPKQNTYLNMKPVEDDKLPTVSIVTLTHNRKKFFRLAILNYNQIDYPKEKLEWIVYDTSNEENQVEDLLPVESKRAKYNIKYFKNNQVETIGESRNFAIKQCSNDIVIFFDDDDYYPEESVKNRVNPLINDNSLNIVGCTNLGTFEINKYLSYVDCPSYFIAPQKRLSIASLAIRRSLFGSKPSFWCEDTSINELNNIISCNLRGVQEINWDKTIISLVHTQNTTWRKVPGNIQGNECKFGFGERVFKFLTELDKSDEELRENEELKKKKIEELKNQKKMASEPTEKDIKEKKENYESNVIEKKSTSED
jgi:glycosyltransferase involved in cell wall biosynthesis